MILNRATDTSYPVMLEIQIGAFGPRGELMYERRYEAADLDDDLAQWTTGERHIELCGDVIREDDRAFMAAVADEALSWVAAEYETAAFPNGGHLTMQWGDTMDNTEWASRDPSSSVAVVTDMEGRPHSELHGACVLCERQCSSCTCDPHMVATARLTVVRSPA